VAAERAIPITGLTSYVNIFRTAPHQRHTNAKRRAVEAIAIGSKRNAGETPAIPVSRDHIVTNEKSAASQIAVSG
jgi:hypothetical protein